MRWRRACPPPGWRLMSSTGTTVPSAPGSLPSAWAMSWRCPAITGYWPFGAANGGCAPIRSPPSCRPAAGTGSAPGPAPRAHAGMTWAWAGAHQPGHSLMIRHGGDGQLAFSRCGSPTPGALATLARVAGTRWAVEEGFQTAKSQAGLDHYQVRTWTAWHRFITLAMLALAFLMACAAQAP